MCVITLSKHSTRILSKICIRSSRDDTGLCDTDPGIETCAGLNIRVKGNIVLTALSLPVLHKLSVL